MKNLVCIIIILFVGEIFMNGPGNNIKKYSEFDMRSNKQKIGICVAGHANYSAPTYIRLLAAFNNINSKYDSCIIDVNKNDEMELVKSDLINETFLLDIIVIERDAFHSNEFIELLIEKCKLFGIKIIYEIDDDLMNIDKSHIDYHYYAKKRLGIFYILKNADIIVVSTNALKSKMWNYSENIVVIPNVLTHYWDINIDKPKRLDDSIIKIGYVGTPTHKDDVKLLEEAINYVKEYFVTYNKTVIFEMIGGTIEKLHWANQFEVPINKRVYPKFVEFVKGFIDWDIALAPLEDNKLNSSKSELKYLEYTGLNIPGIYSEIGPYKENIVHGYNGLLVKENTSQEWAENIITLAKDSELRKNILKHAKEDVNTNHDMSIAIQLWESVLEKVSRDKNTTLYKKFEEFQKNNSSEPFLEFLKRDSYNIIKNSNLFDVDFYLYNYADVANINCNPILHYLKFGASESCNPSESFNTSEYLKQFHNVDLNPFVHYILYHSITNKPLIKFNDKLTCNDFNENYEILKESMHFDSSFYLNHNEDVAKSKMDPLVHWTKYGFKEVNRNPNNYFSKQYYSNKYLVNGEEYWNPLTHYEIIGKSKSLKQNMFDISYKNISYNIIEKLINCSSEKTYIIIPVLCISKHISRLVDSLIKYTHCPFELIIILEHSIKSDFEEILNHYSINFQLIEITNSTMIFESMKMTLNSLESDVVILNSYSVVSNNWLNKLKIRAYSNEDFGAVSPISNFISNISPNSLKKYDSSILLSVNEINTLMQKSSDYNLIELDYFDGSCIYIKKDAIEEVELKSFNFMQNKKETLFGINLFFKNKLHILDDSTYIYVDSAFFKENEVYLTNQNDNDFLLNLKTKKFDNSFEFKNFKDNFLESTYLINNNTLSKRILYILNEKRKNEFERFLLYSDVQMQDNYYLTFNDNYLKLWKQENILKIWTIEYNQLNNINDTEITNLLFNIIYSLNINVVHIHDFTNCMFNISDIIDILGISININCDNFYFICKFSSSDIYCNHDCNFQFNCPHICLKKDNEKWKKLVMKLFNSSDTLFINKNLKERYLETFLDYNNKMVFQ